MPDQPRTIHCVSCGETEAEAVAEDLGWRYGTCHDGEANWLCPGRAGVFGWVSGEDFYGMRRLRP